MKTLMRWFAVGLAVVAGFMAAFGWVVGTPNGASPDDNFHLASIWCPTPLGEHCEVIGTNDEGRPGVMAPESLVLANCNAFRPGESAACQLALSDTKMVQYYHIDDGGYPGGYYDFQHLFAGDTTDETVIATRWVNVAIAVAVWGLLFWLLPVGSRRLMGYAIAGAAIPQMVFLIPSNNPSSWAIIGVTACWLAWHGAAVSHEVWRQRALIGVGIVGAVLAATARADSAAYVAVVTGVLGFMHWPELSAKRATRDRSQDKPLFARIIREPRTILWAAMVVAVVIGVVSYLGAGQTEAIDHGFYSYEGRNPWGVLGWNLLDWPGWWITMWSASLGWLDIPTQPMAWVIATIVGLGLLFYGLGRTNWRKNLCIAGLVGVMIALPLAVMQAGLTYWSDGCVQARYILPLLPALLGVALMRPDRQGALRLSLTQDVAIWAGLSLAHAATLFNVIRRHTVGLGESAPLNLNAAPEWWRDGYPSPLVTWAISAVGFALLLGMFFLWSRRAVTVPAVASIDANEPEVLESAVVAADAATAETETEGSEQTALQTGDETNTELETAEQPEPAVSEN